MMKILIGCEESQEVCKAFRKLGLEAYSCDIQECSGGYPEWHYQADIFEIINLNQWDCLIAFPPCTYLTVTANRWFLNNPERWVKRLDAIMFVYKLMNANIEHIYIENPCGVISTHIRKPDQYIQPYQFGNSDTKKTGLWLKNLPLLKPTNIVVPEFIEYNKKSSKTGKSKYCKNWKGLWGGEETAKIRSKTYTGIAKAMAEQWGNFLIQNNKS